MQTNPIFASAVSIVPRPIFVVGTDTEVGKTFQAVRVVDALSRAGRTVGVYKPVLSGVADIETDKRGSPPVGLPADDASLLLRATGQRWPLDRVCPQAFSAPVAPPVAAKVEGKQVDEQLIVDGLTWWSGRCDILVVEGAGGVLSPISESATILDLASLCSAQMIVVAANRLGVVNHTLLTLAAIRSRRLPILGVVLNEIPRLTERGVAETDPDFEVDASRETNLALLREWETDVPISRDILRLVSSI
ncbi:MAG: dethiobiotin synthase [Aureliella sp.]